ncbi:MAG: tetratricopeptide repeat protein [Ignavibacteriaceae bacterium]|nr:tetratricopeptide repeat protein [Ignavibacteriaceae bacterium]
MISKWKLTGIIATGIIVLMIPISIVLHSPSTQSYQKQAKFVGGKECVSCHQREYELWKGSDHDRAMMVANDSTVLGDFNNVEVEFRGQTHKFYRRDGKFFVYTEGIGGKLTEFQITHTFGVRPLQQYLIPFDKGRYQCLPIAWDSEKNRWFDMAGMVYSEEELKPDSWFHWTNQSQNWNGMCAECHSTNLQKNYDLETDSFNTTWSDINVNCEACHGPGSDHLDWAKLPESSRDYDGNMGLVLKTSETTSKQYIEACAPCHSRRTSFGPNEHQDAEYYNLHRPQNISPPLYYADGQILDEVYVFASFTQSKMYMHDVRCNDCHDSHSIKFKFEDNALCTQCHRPEEYDTFQHHFHKYANEKGELVKNKFGEMIQVGEGALCKTCHMPGNYYMGIDFRRDHSFRIPRPDLSLKYNVPNACNDCHADKSYQWSEDWIKKYFGERKKFTYASVLADGYLHKENADTSLNRLIKNDLYPEMVRATALSYLSAYNSPAADSVIIEMLYNIEPLVRERAIDAFNTDDARQLIRIIFPLLNDPIKMVRISAASKLFVVGKEFFTEEQFKKMNEVLEEYLQTLNYTADFPTGKYNLGNFYSNKSDIVKAEKFYLDAIRMDNNFYPAKSNLALLYYNQGKLKEAENLFLDLIQNHPEYTQGEYYLGLLYAEQKKYKEAAEVLEKATLKSDVNPRIFYNLGLIYQYLNNNSKAETSLLKANQLSQNEFDVLYALADFYIKAGDYTKAMNYAEELKIKFPSNPAGLEIINYLKESQTRLK